MALAHDCEQEAIQLQLNDLADVDAYAVAIRDSLIADGGRPVGQRRGADRDKPSLLSKAALDAREEAEKARATPPAAASHLALVWRCLTRVARRSR